MKENIPGGILLPEAALTQTESDFSQNSVEQALVIPLNSIPLWLSLTFPKARFIFQPFGQTAAQSLAWKEDFWDWQRNIWWF